MRVAINGFGRIGRLLLRSGMTRSDVTFVAINDLFENDRRAYLFKYDSTHGTYPGDVQSEGDYLVVDGHRILCTAEKDPGRLPWKELDVDVVLEATGKFLTKEAASSHVVAGAKRVIMSAPAKDDTKMVVMGVNHLELTTDDVYVSNASCTTNALAPVAKVLLNSVGIDEGLMTTVHSVTASQGILDMPAKKNPRIGRSGLNNIIPSSTGAAAAVGRCIPALSGKLTGMAFRVPVPDVSVVDLTIRTSASTSLEAINQVMKTAAEGELKGILSYTEEPLVSTDLISTTYSGVFDATAGIELNDRFFKLIIWYDNEMGYANRMLDLLGHVGQLNQF
ncbi:MAG: type I glyceraldehyde-3-phosphate dehydrogenase [Acidobacteria bacterium]|nr:type I glyceraldehyde-3-phosphate dehydrogenase [Acidobacteriota bacterium]